MSAVVAYKTEMRMPEGVDIAEPWQPEMVRGQMDIACDAFLALWKHDQLDAYLDPVIA
jgi:hypothetical protein